jgi:integrase
MSRKPLGLSSREDSLTPQEFTMLLAGAISPLDRFIIFTMVFAGLRVSELKHLRRSWVNFDEKTITVPTRQYCKCWECNYVDPKGKKKPKHGLWRPKTIKGARTVPIHPLLLPIMTEFLTSNEEIGLTRISIWAHVKAVSRYAHIFRSIYPHCLRATAATRLALQKISAPSLKYLMGWNSLQAAEDYIKSDMHQAHKEVNEIWKEAG